MTRRCIADEYGVQQACPGQVLELNHWRSGASSHGIVKGLLVGDLEYVCLRSVMGGFLARGGTT